jgi:ligand-binding sensor domain-containing protein
VSGQQYNFINYDLQAGLPNTNIVEIYQDNNSYLWIATEGGGICVFDGASFEIINTKGALASNVVHDIMEDDQELLWVGTQNGISLIQNQKVQASYFEKNVVHKIYPISETELCLGTEKGLYVFDKNTKKATKLRAHPKLNIAQINDIIQIGNKLWVASNKGLFVLIGNVARLMDVDSGLLQNEVHNLALDNTNKLWIAQRGSGVVCINPTSKRIINQYTEPNVQTAQVISIHEDEVWIGTEKRGLQLLNKKTNTWQSVSQSQGLASNNVQVIAKDASENHWIGTRGGGLDKFLGQYFIHYNSDTGLNGNQIYAVLQDSAGKVWVSVDDKGVSTIDSTGIQTDVDEQYINSKCNQIMEDDQGRLWFSTAGGGLVMKDSLEHWVFNELDGLPSSWIMTTVQDEAGDIWVGTYADGIGRIVSADDMGIKVELLGTSSGLADPYITVMQKDKFGRIWYGTKQGGLGYIEEQTIYNIDEPSLPKGEISCLVFDEQNQLWVSVMGKGVYYTDVEKSANKFQKLNPDKIIASNNIEQLIFDREGHLWVGTSLGLDKVVLEQEGKPTLIHFGLNEGFIGVRATRNAAMLDKDGHLWFGTRNGLSKHTPGNTQLKAAPPKIHFTDVSLMYESLPQTPYAHYLANGDSLAPTSIFKHNENNVGFEFTAVNLDYPKNLTYTWKLDGFVDTWSPPTKTQSANFTNLNPGKYRFHVKAVNQVGLSSDIISSSFEITPALWQSLWFQISALLILSLVAYLFFQHRVNQVRKREKAKRVQLEMQNELLSLEQKALQLQMNPHFIFNALNSIQSVVVTQKTDIARDQIQNFAGLMRGILTNSKKQSITLQEEFNTIDKYLKLEQFCQTKAFDYKIELPDGYDPDEIEIPPMMIQPFVENAVFHGVSHLEKEGVIQVIFKIENDLLSCTILDNGVGRKRSAQMSAKKAGHQSVAIEVTQKRLESMKGTKNYRAFQIGDVVNESGGVAGTKVTLKLPLVLTF